MFFGGELEVQQMEIRSPYPKYHKRELLDLTEDCNFWSSHALRLRTSRLITTISTELKSIQLESQISASMEVQIC